MILLVNTNNQPFPVFSKWCDFWISASLKPQASHPLGSEVYPGARVGLTDAETCIANQRTISLGALSATKTRPVGRNLKYQNLNHTLSVLVPLQHLVGIQRMSNRTQDNFHGLDLRIL